MTRGSVYVFENSVVTSMFKYKEEHSLLYHKAVSGSVITLRKGMEYFNKNSWIFTKGTVQKKSKCRPATSAEIALYNRVILRRKSMLLQ